MTEIDATLQVIAIALFLLLLFKDMSGQDQLRGIKEELKRIADALERREKEAFEAMGVRQCSVASCYRRGRRCKGYTIARMDKEDEHEIG